MRDVGERLAATLRQAIGSDPLLLTRALLAFQLCARQAGCGREAEARAAGAKASDLFFGAVPAEGAAAAWDSLVAEVALQAFQQ